MIRNVKNIYYMLSYVYQQLSRDTYRKMGTEEYDNIQNLLAVIIQKEVTRIVRSGLNQEYISYEEITGVPKGKIDFSASIKTLSFQKGKAACRYEIYSENNIFNQVIKTTMLYLVRSKHVSVGTKKELKKLILFFNGIDEIDCKLINWSTLAFHKNFQSYRILINMCYMVINGLLLTTEDGSYRLAEYFDPEKEYRLFQKFVFAYFKKEHTDVKTRAPHIEWELDSMPIPMYMDLLPQMETDIVLEYQGRTIIIDTKYYERMFQSRLGTSKKTFISNNLYQIFSYVKNYNPSAGSNISGMLLYAQTDEDIEPDYTYEMSGNKISIKSLDLNQDWNDISLKLDIIVHDFKSGKI